MARRTRSRRVAGTFRTNQDPATIGPLLREAGFVGSESDPIACVATFDDDGNPRSVSARYADGWRCNLRLLKRGGMSLTQSVSLTIKSRKKS